MDYERFGGDEEAGGVNRQNSAEIAPSEVVSASAKGNIEDVTLKVDEKPGLTIFDIEKKSDLDYVEDPGNRELPKTVME